MAVSFPVPGRQGRGLVMMDEFLGADFTNYPANVDVRRSPHLVNMVRDVPGKVRKSMGYEQLDSYPARINGVFPLRGALAGDDGEDAPPLVHAGTRLYRDALVDGERQRRELYDGAADTRSRAWQFGEKLYFADGKRYLVYDGAAVTPVDSWEKTYVPVATIAKAPKGGGTQYEGLNLLTPKFTERFLGTAADKQYTLSYENLAADAVQARVLNNAGDWVAKRENTDFTVNRTTGVVTFNTAPGESPITGEDNVEITAVRTGSVEEYRGRINRCRFGIPYGVGGAGDRLFLSGNPDPKLLHYDWFSGKDDPSYFSDLGYSTLGSSSSAVVGYSILNDRLAAHKDEHDPERNVIVRSGTLADKQAAFPIVGTLQGPGAVAPHSFGYLAAEPLFLSRLGVYAITPQDLNGERVAQNRSFYLDGKLLKEQNLQEATACIFRDYYILCLNGAAYLLDGLQAVPPARGMPYSTRHYCGFYRTNLPARVMWQQNERLYFGTGNGKVYRFFDEPRSPGSYTDDGEAITARWETPELVGQRFFKNKSFGRLSVRLGSAVATGVDIYAFVRGRWRGIKSDHLTAGYLDFGQVVFSKFSFKGDRSPQLIGGKIPLRRLDKVRFAAENREKTEPFALFGIAVEYREHGYSSS